MRKPRRGKTFSQGNAIASKPLSWDSALRSDTKTFPLSASSLNSQEGFCCILWRLEGWTPRASQGTVFQTERRLRAQAVSGISVVCRDKHHPDLWELYCPLGTEHLSYFVTISLWSRYKFFLAFSAGLICQKTILQKLRFEIQNLFFKLCCFALALSFWVLA